MEKESIHVCVRERFGEDISQFISCAHIQISPNFGVINFAVSLNFKSWLLFFYINFESWFLGKLSQKKKLKKKKPLAKNLLISSVSHKESSPS